MNQSGYIVVLTPIEFSGPSGIEIAPGYKLVRASNEQVKEIKGILSQFQLGGPPFFELPYEFDFRPGEKGTDRTRHKRERIPQEKWRYWIIAFDGIGATILDLISACGLISPDLELGFYAVWDEESKLKLRAVVWDALAVAMFLHSAQTDLSRPQTVTENDLQQIRPIFNEIGKLPSQFIHIKRALKRFEDLRRLPRSAELVTIGLFSILESLVTHAPKLIGSEDSLSHQIRTKMPLLRKQFDVPIDHAMFFPGVKERDIWNSLYEYRSRIVHGENSDLPTKLKSASHAGIVDFLRQTAKRLLRLSLSNPVFLTDLKEC